MLKDGHETQELPPKKSGCRKGVLSADSSKEEGEKRGERREERGKGTALLFVVF